METQNHLGDALDSRYVTSEEHAALFTLADRAIGASTRLHQYLKTCKRWPGTMNPRTQNRGTKNPEPGTKNEPRTLNPEPVYDPLTFSTCSMTRRMLPPRIFSMSASL